MARIESAADEVRRIDRTGTTWFAAAILAVAISVAGARVAGWSPLEIATPAAILWWACAAALSVGIAALAWAGCPVLGFSAGGVRPAEVAVRACRGGAADARRGGHAAGRVAELTRG